MTFLYVAALIAAAFLIAVLWADNTTPPDDDDFTQPTHVRVLTDQEHNRS